MKNVMDGMLISTPEHCGGLLRIAGTRITVHQIVTLYKQGLLPEEIADQYPQLTHAHVYAALAYYHANREEVERSLADELAEADIQVSLSSRGSDIPSGSRSKGS